MLSSVPAIERRLDLAGIPTAVLEVGDGPPMVLLHGPGAYAAAWLPAIPALATGHRIVAPDLPGHGATAVGDEKLDSERVLAWLTELIDVTCPAPPVLVGQLIGGAIAARFAAAAPDRLRSLILVVPFGLAPFAPTPAFGAALNGFLTDPTGQTHDTLFGHCVHDLQDVRSRLGPRWDAMRAYNLALARTPAVADALRTMMDLFATRPIPDDELARISVPTTLIWGADDEIVPVTVGEAAAARYGWPLRVLDGVGNEPAMEDPDAFVKAATSFGSVQATHHQDRSHG